VADGGDAVGTIFGFLFLKRRSAAFRYFLDRISLCCR
jgi:hypothetical protein